MAISKVVVVDGNNLIVQIDRGVAGRGVTDVEPVEIDNSLYLVFTFSDGTTETVGPVGTIQYIGQSPIVVTGSTISLSTVPVTLGGTGQITANAGFNALAPSQTSNTGKYLKTDGTNTSWDLLDISTGDITGTLPVTNGGTGATTASGARTNLAAAASATTISAGTGLSGGGDLTANRTLSIANTGVTAAAYGSASKTLTATVNAQGQLTVLADTNIAITNTQVSGLGTASTLNAGVALGVATLDAGGTVPLSQIPASIQGGVSYQGTWNATTNTPTLTSSVGSKGYYYVVSVAGSTNLNGITTWNIGDWAIFNGTAWEKIDNTDAVTSVNGYTGTVVLTNTDITGFGTMSTQNANNVSITGGSVTGITDLAIADGGTGQSTAAAAITALTGTQVAGRYLRSDGTNAALSAIQAADVPTLNQNTTGTAAGLSATLAIASGGTGQTTANTAFNALAPSQTGNSGKYLTTDGSDTSWATNPLGTVTSVDVSGGTTGLTTSGGPVTTSGTITLAGTLATTNGGTGLTSFTANGVVYASSTSALATGSALTFDGTQLGVNVAAPYGGAYATIHAFAAGGATLRLDRTGAGTSTIQSIQTGSAYRDLTLDAANNIFSISGSEQMRLTSTGLGIGTSSVAYKLQVASGATAATSYFSSTATPAYSATAYNGGNARIAMVGGGASGATTGINFSQGGSFEAYFGGVQESGGAAAFVWQGYNGSAYAERMRLDSSGNLGIGTSSPAAKLDVQGSAGTSTPLLILKNNSAANASNIAQEQFFVANAFGGLEQVASITALNTNAGNNNSGTLTFATSALGTASTPTERMRLDSSGNLGLGVTPSAWYSDYRVMQLGLAGAIFNDNYNEDFNVSSNAFADTRGGYKYIRTGFAQRYVQANGGGHRWFNSSISGTAGDPITFTQAMTLDASGNLGIGRTDPSNFGKLAVSGTIAPVSPDGQTQGVFSADNTGKVIVGGYNGSGTNFLAFNAGGGTERARIDSSGNLLVGGTSSLGYRSQIFSATNGYTQALVQTSAFSSGNLSGTVYAGYYDGSSITDMASIRGGKENTTSGNYAGMLAFYTRANGGSDTERARIDSSGNLLVGRTSSIGGARVSVETTTGTPTYAAYLPTTGTETAFLFVNPNGAVGSITTNGSATLYNVTSDQRLKENIQDAAPASALIDSLQVRQYDWKADGSHQRYGFVAQELVTVAPEAVHQPADPEQMMAVDYSKLVPMLVKEIQSLRTRLAALEAK